MEEKLYEFLFEVLTYYKSGKTRTDIIASDTEEEMWEYYDKHHNAEKIDWCGIVDCWIQ